MRWPVILLAMVAAWIGHAAAANEVVGMPEYTSRSWHVEDGLPGEEIVALQQDPTGFLWVATTAGLARFDGMHFEPYRLGADVRSYARVLASSRTLGLLAVLPRDGIMRFNRGGFRPLRSSPLLADPVQGLFVDPAGGVWISGDNATLLRRDDKGHTVDVGRALPFAGVRPPRPDERGPRSLASDDRGRVWLAEKGLVARYDGGAWVKWPDRFGGAELRIGSSTHGAPWLVTRDRVLRLKDNGAQEVVRIPALVSAHYIHALVEDRDGDLWIGTRSQGLFVVSHGQLRHVATSQEEITALYCDNDGNLWVGTNGGGIDRIRRKSYRIYDTSSGLLQNLSYSVLADAQGDVWLANRDGGVARIHHGAVEIMVAPSSLPALSAISLFRAPSGAVGVTGGTGIFLVPQQPGGPVQKLTAVPTIPIVRVTFTARNGDVWFSVDPDRIGRLRDNQFRTFGADDGMTGKQVRGLAEDSQGRIWVGTTDGQLFEQEGARFRRVPLGAIDTGGINAIDIEPDDTVWLGTVSAGIVGFANGQARSCSVAQGLPDQNIAVIVPDGHGQLWCGSKGGVFRVSRQDLGDWLSGRVDRLMPMIVGQEDGVRGLACSGGFQPAACRSRDGALWFATRRGVLQVDPDKPAEAAAPPPVQIEEVRADDGRVPLSRPLVIGPKVHKVQLRFGVLNLSAPDRVVARYRLQGFDDDWVDAGASRVATYPRLPAGDYRFEVTARNADTTETQTADGLTIRFLPQWWQTWWCRLGGFALATGLIGGAARFWSHRRLRRRLERLERETAVERERTRIAQNIHDDVGASLTRISLLAQHAQHEVAGGSQFFDEIYGTATDITRSLDEIVWAVNPKYDNIDGLANYLGNFAQRFLDVARLRCRLDIPDQLPAIPLAGDARHNVFLGFKEALNNIVKHARATAVQITLAMHEGELVISIQDDGRGVAAAADAGTAPRAGGGNGLGNMRQRMASVGGTCTVRAASPNGTLVILRVPIVGADAGELS